MCLYNEQSQICMDTVIGILPVFSCGRERNCWNHRFTGLKLCSTFETSLPDAGTSVVVFVVAAAVVVVLAVLVV